MVLLPPGRGWAGYLMRCIDPSPEGVAPYYQLHLAVAAITFCCLVTGIATTVLAFVWGQKPSRTIFTLIVRVLHPILLKYLSFSLDGSFCIPGLGSPRSCQSIIWQSGGNLTTCLDHNTIAMADCPEMPSTEACWVYSAETSIPPSCAALFAGSTI